MYVYRTSQFTQKAERYGIQTQLDRFCVELETQDIVEVQAHFKRVYPYLKRKVDNNLRLMGKILTVDDTHLLCLLDIFKRGDKDYEHFLLNPQDYGTRHLDSQLDDEKLYCWLQHRRPSEGSTPTRRSLLPDELRPWLEPSGWEIIIDDGAIVYESEEWLRRFESLEIQKDSEIYYRLISALVDSPTNAEIISQWQGVNLCGEKNWYVLFSLIETADIPKQQVLFLIAPFNYRPSIREIAEIGHKTHLFNNSRNILSQKIKLDDLTPFARRSYPGYLLADDEAWLAVEGNEETNLALSAEEESILNSVALQWLGKNSLPIFLNGQAGSGKSTMLSYLFAEYCYRKYYNEKGQRRNSTLPGNPLFLTYNVRLLEVVRKKVIQLLESHHQFIARRNDNNGIPDITNFFQPFQNFLISLLPPKERDRFDADKYISFHSFKQHYKNLRVRKSYSPELCWHVIRTFIKGYSLKGYMEPQEYQEVPRRESTFSAENFQEIYEIIWERWYKRLTTDLGYWDDQDLIRMVLQLKCYRSEYTAVFCDEAQDFTRLELQLIMRLSVFSQYDLSNQPLANLPFAFAGDPFQTLNPTGFRWESVRAAFYNEVIAALDPEAQLHLGMNFQELERNYRSSPPIVQVNNLIQLWRHVLFNIPELKPQIAWHTGDFTEPQKFIISDNIHPEELIGYVRDTIIIVPCEEGEEAAYAQKDELLSKILSGTRNGEPPKNVLSAMTAKGLEFKRVILYKFGEACNRGVWEFSSEQGKVKDEYFFNKLYVAASRATEHLFVVDSETGDRQLWQYASDESQLQVFLQRANKRSQWQERVQVIRLGTSETAQQMREDDPQSTAQELKTKGLDAQNPYLLRRAKQYYSDTGNTTEAALCEAWAFKFEERFLDAGSRFLHLGKVDEAWDCFWQGMCWLELLAWYKQHSHIRISEYYLVDFMTQPATNLEAIKTFTQFLKNYQFENNRYSKQWKKALEEYANRIGSLMSLDNLWEKKNLTLPYEGRGQGGLGEQYCLDSQEWLKFGDVLLGCWRQMGDKGLLELAGACFYRAHSYEGAVQCWEQCDVYRREYYLAKAATLGKPDGLPYLEKAGEHEGIISEWKEAGKPRAPEWLKYVALAFEVKNDYQNAFVVYIWLDNSIKVKYCFEKASLGVPEIKLLKVFLQYSIRKQHWDDAIGTINKYLTTVTGSEAEQQLKFDVVYELALAQPGEMIKEARESYEKFIKEQVLSNSEWRSHLLIEQVGVALEKIGSLVETLRFYEGFVDRSHPNIRKFARARWLATKLRQADYLREQGLFDKADKSQLEVTEKARKWRMAADLVAIDPPSVDMFSTVALPL